MFSAKKDQSASGRGTAQASASSNDYRVVLPRLPTGKLVTDSVFLHADLAGRPYRAQDFRDALRNVLDLNQISSIGQFQMSHVWMVTCKTAESKARLVSCGDLSVKSRRCVVVDPEPKEVRMKLLWLPERLDDAYVREALQVYGKVTSISGETWKVADMERMRTLSRDVTMSLADGVGVSDVPHVLTVCGVQSLVLIPGRPPLCLRCNRVGHIRRHCRTPRCEDCRRFGHTADECVVTYADKLRHQTRPPDDALQEHIMDATEVLDATGDLPAAARVESCVSASATEAKQTDVTQSEQTVEDNVTQLGGEVQIPVAGEEPASVPEDPEDASTDTLAPTPAPEQQLQGHFTVPVTGILAAAEESLQKRRASCASDSSGDDDQVATKHRRRRRASKHKGKCRRSRSRSPGGAPEAASPSPDRHMQV